MTREAKLDAQRMTQEAIEALPNPIFFIGPDRRCRGVNEAWERFFGISREAAIGKTAHEIFAHDRTAAEAAAALDDELLREPGSRSYDAIIQSPGSGARDVVYYKATYGGREGPIAGVIATIVDMTERKRAEQAVKFMAMHDALTGLPNRTVFNERLTRAIVQARRYQRALAVLFVDLDRFKLINDTLGHDAGDTLLREAAQRLTENLRAGDTVARLGGDEFVVLLEEVVDPLYVGSVSRKLIEALSAPYTIGGSEYCITASIGVSAFPEDGGDAETLLKHADIAMYRAKERGRNAFEFYSAQITAGSLERLNLETGLRRALERREELTLHYQPQIEACTGRVVGMEALVRWMHPKLGLLAPNRFIRIAEETGLIVPLGEWVLHTACRAHREWQRMRVAPARMAVNLSPRQFLHAGLLNDTMRVLSETSCNAKYIELEITESMVMHDPAGAVEHIRALQELGVRIAMDDFGTGYSSLAHLRHFPIDSLKIDRSFIADVPNDAGNVAISQAIIAMARTLQLTVIAEGVETAAQFNFVRSRGCDEVQGYYFSPPIPFEEATALLRQQHVSTALDDSDTRTAMP